jgi:Cu2+-exporting ATPase
MVVLSERLGVLADGVRKARDTRSVIKQNLAWAILYNTAAVPLAAVGLVAPWMAAIGMSASSLVVVFNALRLKA